MSTSMAGNMKRDSAPMVGGGAAINWEERKDPKKFEFGDGVELVGVLTAVERVNVRDTKTGVPKPAVRYSVKPADSDEPVFFFGTHQLDQKIMLKDVGHHIAIICQGEDKSVSRNGNAMKIFRVNISREFAPGWANDGTQITDSDLPPADSY